MAGTSALLLGARGRGSQGSSAPADALRRGDLDSGDNDCSSILELELLGLDAGVRCHHPGTTGESRANRQASRISDRTTWTQPGVRPAAKQRPAARSIHAASRRRRDARHTLTVCSLPLKPERSSFASSTGSATVRSTTTSRLLDLRLRDGAMLTDLLYVERPSRACLAVRLLSCLCVTSAMLCMRLPRLPCVFSVGARASRPRPRPLAGKAAEGHTEEGESANPKSHHFI